MALVPHKITALAESDAEGTDGKNIVSGAVVSLYDTDGAAVTLFDDASGSNGSTAKQTDATGQVVVYVTAGEYDEEVNGSIRRKVSIGSKQVTTLQLIDSLGKSQVGDTVTTTGYESAGDGLGAQYVSSATTGLTPSQSFSDVSNLYIVDGTGRRWDLVRQGNQIALWKLGAKAGNDITSLLTAATNGIGNDGGTIILPYATEENPCIISAQTTVRKNVLIKGLGRRNSWLKAADGMNANMFYVDRTESVELSGLSLDGNADNQTAGNGINVFDSPNISISDVAFKNIYSAPITMRDVVGFQINDVWVTGGGDGDSRGISFSTCRNGNVSNFYCVDYTGSALNIGESSDIVATNINATRDYIALGWTLGKAAVRCTNDTQRVSISGVYSYGYSRGIFILTGSKDISISSFTIDSCENFGVWVEGDNGSSGDSSGTKNITLSGGTIQNTGLVDLSNDESVRLSDTTGCVISGVVCDNNIVEENTNATSDKNIITSNRVLGSIITVGANTVSANNITGA